MLQAPMLDGLAFDLLPFQQDDVATSEVDVGGREIAQAFVITLMIVVFDEGLDVSFEVTGQVIVFQQDAVLQGLMPALDLALGLGMVATCPSGMRFEAAVFPTRATDGRITHMKEAKQQRQVKGKKVRHLPGPHVLRHTFVTFGMSLGVPEYEIGILVNHRLPKGSMTQRYVGRHAMLTDRLREVQEAVSTALTEAMGRAKK